MKICNRCNKKYSDELYFCPSCKSMLLPYIKKNKEPPKKRIHRKFDDNFKFKPHMSHGISHSKYDDWNPPSANRIYRLIANISYGQYKYSLARGFDTTKTEQIKRKLGNKFYCCQTCSYYMEYGNLCNLRNMEVVAHLSICKSFEPKIDAYPKSKMDKKENKKKKNPGFNVCVRCKICGKKFNRILDHNLHQLEHLED